MDNEELIKKTVLAIIEEQKALRAKVDALEMLFFAAASFIPEEDLIPRLQKELETMRAHDLNSQISDATIDTKARHANDMLSVLILTMRRYRG